MGACPNGSVDLSAGVKIGPLISSVLSASADSAYMVATDSLGHLVFFLAFMLPASADNMWLSVLFHVLLRTS